MSTNRSLCKCGSYRTQYVTSSQAKFPGRSYFKCSKCKSFEWVDAAPLQQFDQEAGPLCVCQKATILRTVKKDGPNKGRKFWACAAYPGGCKFFQWKEGVDEDDDRKPAAVVPGAAAAVAPGAAAAVAEKPPPLPGFASFLSDWRTLQLIEKMMEIDDVEQMKRARFERGEETNYDKLLVKGVWHISNASRMEKYQAAKKRVQLNVKLSSGGATNPALEMREDYQTAMMELGKDILDLDGAGEVLLLHGTRPEPLYKVLFEGLDPELSRGGLFGKGSYFCDNAAKMDMYSSMDRRFDKDGPLNQLHKKIYQNCHHPRAVQYALIARVLLGKSAKTKDGKTQLDSVTGRGKQLFQNAEQTQLARLEDGTAPNSLVALPGQKVSFYSEYVMFHPHQVFVEYLVAYQRVRAYCDCKLPVTERTVSKATENRGRRVHLCGNIELSNEKKCEFCQMFPLCQCGKSAVIKISHSTKNPGRSYYCCHKKQQARTYHDDECDFFEWADNAPPSTNGGSPYKKQRL